MIQAHLDEGSLTIVKDGPDFAYPAYVIYQEEFSSPAIMERALKTLRQVSGKAIEGALP